MGEIINKQGFSLVTYDGIDWHILINDNNTLSAKNFMLDHNITKIQLNYTAGFTKEKIDFLEHYSFVDEITIIPGGDIDISGIHFLDNLRKMRITKRVIQGIHFNLFPHLQRCSVEWNTKNRNLESCISLEDLTLYAYKAHDLSMLSGLINLKRVKIGSSPIKVIDGIESLKLKSLSLNYNRKLSSLKGIENLSSTLSELNLLTCKAISSIEEVALLSNLEELGVNNCGEIDSIKALTKLKKLKQFTFWESTNIIDGDVSPCIGIKQVAFQNRRNYNYTNEEIDKINLINGL